MISIRQYLTEGRRPKQEAQKVIEGTSILDKIMNNEQDNVKEFVQEFIRPNGPTIYAFTTDKVDSAVKVGYTDQHPEKRIEQWREIYGKEEGEVVPLGYWSSEEFDKAGERVFFWDHAIHKKLQGKGYKQLSRDEFMNTLTEKGKQLVDIHYSREFFSKYKKLLQGQLSDEDKEELSAQLLEDLINQMKLNIKNGTADFKLYKFDEEGRTSGKQADKQWGSPDTYQNTDLQEEAIKNGVKAIKEGKKNILMAAVMRFGKTHASYEIVKEAGLKRVIVCSAKADVRTAWREDINHVHFFKDFVFIEVLGPNNWDVTYSKDGKSLVTEHGIPDIEALEKSGKTIIYFFTLHDLGGSVKELKAKHKGLFDKNFDMMIVDETHYGSHANTFGQVTGLGRKKIEDDDEDNAQLEEEQKLAEESKKVIESLNVKYDRVLQVSGTPYYILASNEMIDKDAAIISKVSYTDMLNARDKWEKEHKGEDESNSPYFGIPTLHKIGLRLNKECRKIMEEAGYTDSMTELFKVNGQKFVNEKAIRGLIKGIFGDGKSSSLAFLKNKDVDGNKVCKHTIMVLPRVKACRAMKELLNSMIDTNERKVFCIVNNWGGIADVKDVDDLNNQLEKLDSEGKKSIILTVNRFMTGVSMPCIDSMIYLKNASSPQEYDQNIFRLCTRRVKKVKDPDNESRSKKVNMKDNVYLIDFNMSNMFNMVANSARMKAAAEGNPTTKRIKEFMEDDLKAVPIFAEDKASSEILGKMHKITSKDMMELYTRYNKNKSISDIVNDEIDLFGELFKDKDFQDIIVGINIDGDKSKITVGDKDENDGETIDNIPTSKIDKKLKSLQDKIKDSRITDKDKKEFERLTKEKFKAITKNLLYCDLCLDEPCFDIEGIIEKAKKDSEFKKMLHEFKIELSDIEKVYKVMDTNYKQAYNSLLTRMALLAQDKSKEGYDKFSKALEGLGRLGQSEVVTPPEIVEKMINKLDESEYQKAKSILLVNEKQAEFAMGLVKKFGKDILKKVKIVASSEIGKHLTKKMLKSTLGNNYIDNIILNIDDIDGNGYYDVKDFLHMKNEQILKENNGKKFDIILSNPPYSNTLHLQFLEKYCEIAKNIISIQPCEFITRTHLKPTYKKQKEKYKNSIGKHLYDLEVLKKNPFDAGIDTNIGIYVLNETGGFDYDNFYKEYDKHYLNIESKFNTGITFNEKLEKYDNQKYFVPIRTDGIYERWWTLQLINYLDIIVDGKVYSGDYKGLTISEARKKNPHENPRNADRTTMGVSFNSLEEAINCRDSLKTEAYMFIIALFKTTRKNPLNKIPFLNYKNHLSNNDIFDLFDINNDLRKDIIKEMQPFMGKSSMNGSEIGKTLINIQKKYLEELNKNN